MQTAFPLQPRRKQVSWQYPPGHFVPVLQAPRTPPRVQSVFTLHGDPASPSVGCELQSPPLHALPRPQLVHAFAPKPQALG